MSAPAGRRERKKQLTRQAISDVATRLFLERGFDAVTVAEIAAAADVAVQTVFNHFSTKEDLFFDDLSWVTAPARAVRAGSGRPAVAVLEEDYRAAVERVRARGHLATSAQFARTIAASPALRARRARLAEELQDRLTAALVEHDRSGPVWRARLLAARYAATRRVLDDELAAAVPEGAPDSAVERLQPVIAAAFASLTA